MDAVTSGVKTYINTRHVLGDAIVNAIPDVYNMSLHMITSGNINQIIVGLLAGFGITVAIVRGLWKLIASSLGHQILGFVFRGIVRLIGLLSRRSYPL